MLLELLRDRVDAQHGDRLTMAVLAAIIVPALLLEDDDFVAALVLDDGRADRGARDQRGAGGRALGTAFRRCGLLHTWAQNFMLNASGRDPPSRERAL
jgi:hypothetical protein